MSPVEFVIDLDGTILDSRARQCGVLAHCLATLGLPETDLDRFWRNKRSGLSTLAALVADGFTRDLAAQVSRRWIELIEDENWLALDRPLPTVMTTLRAIADVGYSTTILTARRNPRRVPFQLEAAKLLTLVDSVIVVDPKNTRQEKAGHLSRIHPALFVGDSESDGEAASLAGVRFVSVTTGQRSGDVLASLGYDTVGSLAASFEPFLGQAGSGHSEMGPC